MKRWLARLPFVGRYFVPARLTQAQIDDLVELTLRQLSTFKWHDIHEYERLKREAMKDEQA